MDYFYGVVVVALSMTAGLAIWLWFELKAQKVLTKYYRGKCELLQVELPMCIFADEEGK